MRTTNVLMDTGLAAAAQASEQIHHRQNWTVELKRRAPVVRNQAGAVAGLAYVVLPATFSA